jgi:hypothetical protein
MAAASAAGVRSSGWPGRCSAPGAWGRYGPPRCASCAPGRGARAQAFMASRSSRCARSRAWTAAGSRAIASGEVQAGEVQARELHLVLAPAFGGDREDVLALVHSSRPWTLAVCVAARPRGRVGVAPDRPAAVVDAVGAQAGRPADAARGVDAPDVDPLGGAHERAGAVGVLERGRPADEQAVELVWRRGRNGSRCSRFGRRTRAAARGAATPPASAPTGARSRPHRRRRRAR